MSKVTLAENIYWVGAVDWNIRDFHGYTTRRGTTYNAYLILFLSSAKAWMSRF